MTYPAKELFDFLSADAEIRQKYTDSGLQNTRPSIKIGAFQTSPDLQICITDTGGAPYSDRIPTNQHFIQIRVRATDYDIAMKYAVIYRNRLESITNVKNTPLSRWAGVYILSEPAQVNRDPQDLPIISVNFRILRNTGGDGNKG